MPLLLDPLHQDSLISSRMVTVSPAFMVSSLSSPASKSYSALARVAGGGLGAGAGGGAEPEVAAGGAALPAGPPVAAAGDGGVPPLGEVDVSRPSEDVVEGVWITVFTLSLQVFMCSSYLFCIFLFASSLSL